MKTTHRVDIPVEADGPGTSVLADANPGDVTIVQFGVGSADCTLIIVKDTDLKGNSHTISTLIDCASLNLLGCDFSDTYLWLAIEERLRAVGHNKLDFLVVSHLEEDHVGLAGPLLTFLHGREKNDPTQWGWVKRMRVISRLKFQAVPADGDPYRNWALPVDQKGKEPNVVRRFRDEIGRDEAMTVKVGDDLFRKLPDADADLILKNAQLMCIASNGVVGQARVARQKGEREKKPVTRNGQPVPISENDLSFAFLLRFGNFYYYTGGDLTGTDPNGKSTNLEAPLVKSLEDSWPANQKFHTCALKINHHGGKYSTQEEFILWFKPDIAVFSAALRGSDTTSTVHPSSETVDRLRKARSRILLCTYRLTPTPVLRYARVAPDGNPFTSIGILKDLAPNRHLIPQDVILRVNVSKKDGQNLGEPPDIRMYRFERDKVRFGALRAGGTDVAYTIERLKEELQPTKHGNVALPNPAQGQARLRAGALTAAAPRPLDMALAEIYDRIKTAIQQADDAKGTNITTETIKDRCFAGVLGILSIDKGLVFSGAVTLEPRTKEQLTNALMVAGTARFLGRESPVTVTFRGEGSSRRCFVQVTSILAGQNELKINDISIPLSLFEQPILEKPRVELANLGFDLEGFLTERLERPDFHFKVTGEFSVAGAMIRGAVELPVARTRVSDQWRVTFEAGNVSPAVTPQAVASWLGIQTEMLVKEIPAEIFPADGKTGFSLKRLMVDFDGKTRRVEAIQAVIRVSNPWRFADALALELIDVVFDVLTLPSPDVSVRLEAQLSIDGTATESLPARTAVKAIVTFGSGSFDSIISFYTAPPDAQFTAGQLSSLLEGFKLTDLQLPIDSGQKLFRLIDLTFALQLNATPKLRSIRLAVATTIEWEIVDKVLLLASPQFSLELIRSRESKTWQASARLVGLVKLLGEFKANFEMARNQGRWILAAQALDEVPLSDILSRFSIDGGIPSELEPYARRKVTDLGARYATGTASQASELSLNAAIADLVTFPLGDFKIEVPSLSVDLRSTQLGKQSRETSITVSSAFRLQDFCNAQMRLAFTYDKVKGGNREWRVLVEALGLRGEYLKEGGRKRVEISLGSTTFGDIMRKVHGLVEPGGSMIRLPEPWNLLEGIRLEGAVFTFYFDKPDPKNPNVDPPRFGVTYKFDPEADLRLIRLKEIGFNYTQKGKLKITGQARFVLPGKEPRDLPPIDWDPRSEPAPSVPFPSSGGPIDLDFLALGQRLELRPTKEIPEIRRVSDALGLMQQAFSKNDPFEILLGEKPPLGFDPQRGLLIGADFSLFGTLSTKLVFNDGVVAGVSLGLSGPRARYFRGLDFEILYKKVSEGIGVYQVELEVPDGLRQIELGAVSLTIPSIALEIYTNGNFRVDLGFPRNNDFSRSFQLQAFPYLGSGGFYFAKLTGITAPRLPRAYSPNRGKFDPVLAFGVGLSIGVGKSINRGILAAELSLNFEGILEGVLAFFTGRDVNGKPVAPDSLYYWTQGTLGIVGRIRGRVSFSVITAEVSLVVAARIGIALESFQPLVLSFTAAVNINLVVSIGAGWLSVDVCCSFATEISEQFTIPLRNPGLPAWIEPGREPVQRSKRALPRSGRTLPAERLASELAPGALRPSDVVAVADQAQVASRPIPRMSWDPIELLDEQREELRLLFRPQFTMAKVDNEQVAHCVALLFLRSIGSASPEGSKKAEDLRSDFDRLAEAMLLWCINSLRNQAMVVKSAEPIRQMRVSVEDLEGIYRVLTQKGRGAAPFTSAQVTAFLRRYFRIVIEAPERPQGGLISSSRMAPTVAIFPMIPELRVEARVTIKKDPAPNNDPKLHELLHYAATFDEQTVVSLSYHDEILDYFDRLASEFRTDLEKITDTAAADPEPQELAVAGGRSIAEFVFEDYFLLIARAVIQSSLDLLKTYSDTTGDYTTLEGDTIARLSGLFGVSIDKVAAATRRAQLAPGLEILLGGGIAVTMGNDSFAAIASRFAQAAEPLLIRELGRANAFVSGLLLVGATINLSQEEYKVTDRDTLDSVSKKLGLTDGAGELALAIALEPGFLSPNVRLLVPINGRTYVTLGAGESLANIAVRYTGAEDLRFAMDLGALNAYVPSLLRENEMLDIPGEQAPYQVKQGDTLASIATAPDRAGPISPMTILAANFLTTGIFASGVVLAIPPTRRRAEAGDTLESVAMRENLPLDTLATDNAETPGFFATGQQLSITRGTIKVDSLIAALLEEKKSPDGTKQPSQLFNLSGMASRFMLPGVRLPKPSSLVEDVRSLWPNGEPAPLYAATGQQFALPKFASMQMPPPAGQQAGIPAVKLDPKYVKFDIDLKLPERGDIASWYEFAGSEEATEVTIPLYGEQPIGGSELLWIEEIRTKRLEAKVEQFKPMETCHPEPDPRRFPLANRVGWLGSPPQFSRGGANARELSPSIWTISEGLRQALSKPQSEPLALTLDFGKPANENREVKVNFEEALPYGWATALNVRIRKVADFQAIARRAPSPKLIEMAYEIEGVDAEEVLLLEEILRRAGPESDESFIKEIRILYPSKAIDGAPALLAKDPAGISAFILQTNLSTLTSPRSLSSGLAPSAEPVSAKLEILRLLLQASIVRSGGYYLFYRTNNPPAGLPADIFDNGAATITIVVTFDFPKRSDKPQYQYVLPFVNRAVVGKTTAVDSMLFATSNLLVKQPLLPPGHTGFVAKRVKPMWNQLDELGRPPIDPDSQHQLEFLFSLLGCRVESSASFKESIEVPADGPEATKILLPAGMPDGGNFAGAWQYTKVIPFYKFSRAPLTSPIAVQLPDPNRNPYRGIGEKLQVRIDWFDGFGNKTLWPLNAANQSVFDLQLGYADELIGVERWPAVNAGYSVQTNEEGDPKICVQLDFDVSRYTPHGQGQGTVADAKKMAQADLEVFRKIYYQLTWGNTKVWLSSTVDQQRVEFDAKAVIRFIGEIFKYLDSIGTSLYAFATDVGRAGQLLSDIAKRFNVSLTGLQRLNPGLPSKLKEDTVVILPNLGLPQRLELSYGVSLSNPDAIFPLTVKLEIERIGKIEDVVDAQFRTVRAVKSVEHELEPLALVAGNGGGEVSGAIRDFAREFEGVFDNTKLATGLSHPSHADSDSRNRLWVVQIGSAITYKIDAKDQHFFAPIPLATTLLGANNLVVLGYNKENQELKSAEKPYAGIDLDEWARRFLSAIDTFFLPQYAVPACILDKQSYQSILEDKRKIASSIANSVEGIAERTGGDRDQAKELLRQRMLVNLSAAYDVDTIAQIGVLVESPFDFFPEAAPKFYGQPVAELAKLPAPGAAQPPEKPDLTLSTARIPLVDGPSYLTFLFDSEKVEPEQLLSLNLSYEATALEHAISDIPGVKDLKSSSWLTFLIPENVIPNDQPLEVKVPIPIRADPIRPSVEAQAVDLAYPDRQDLKLEETRQYAYSYQYSRGRSAHDLVYTSPRFNSVKPSEEAKREAVNRLDLFQALASFDGAWDAIRQDLLGTLPELKSADTSEEAKKTLNALKALAKLVSLIATAWKTWQEKEMPSVGPPEPGDRYKYEQKQVSGGDDYVISERKSEQDDSWQITVGKCNAPAGAPIPAIRIKDWEQVEIKSTNANERRFQFKTDGISMTAEDVEDDFDTDSKITRTVVFENAANDQGAAEPKARASLDILNKENAWPELRITRNEALFGDFVCMKGSSPRTNPRFVYHTPWVGFAEILKPRIEYGKPIDIAKLPREQGKDPDNVLQRPLEDHLSRLFKRFFESVPNPGGKESVKRRMQLTCRYQYDLNKPANENDLLVITLPMVMAPPFDFTILEGKNSAAKSFPQSLAEAIKAWFDERHPSGKNSRFVFDISVYSRLDPAKLPVYRLSNLQLRLKDMKKI